jgi:hypothetical protein
MASSFSTDLKLELMVTGENAGTWGTKTNTNLNLLQQAIAGFQSISIAGGAQTTALTMDNAALSNARNAVVKLTGTITGNQIVTVPNGIEKTYIVQNGTTGAFTVEFKTAGGTGVTFAATNKGFKIVYSDGTNIVDVELSSVNPIIEKILDTNGNEEIIFTATASAVNELTIANAATGNAPSIATSGSDTNISLTIAPKGTGDVNIDADTLRVGDSNADATITTNGTGDLTLSTNSGSNSGTIKIFDAADGNIEITPNGTGVVKLDGLSYPTADGSANQALVTDGNGVLSFATPSSGKVLQVIQVTKVGTQTINGTVDDSPETFTDISDLSASITPSSASNKILILANVLGGSDNNSFITAFRGATNLAVPTSPSGRTPAFAGDFVYFPNAAYTRTYSIIFLDSPSTTSSTTYKLGGAIWGANSLYINRAANDVDAGYQPRAVSTLILMEIAG